VNTAEVVVREVQSAGVFQVIEFLGIGIRQTSKAAKRHANRKIAALYKAGRDVAAACCFLFQRKFRTVPLNALELRTAPRLLKSKISPQPLKNSCRTPAPDRFRFYWQLATATDN
jgi:hypothetical protein